MCAHTFLTSTRLRGERRPLHQWARRRGGTRSPAVPACRRRQPRRCSLFALDSWFAPRHPWLVAHWPPASGVRPAAGGGPALASVRRTGGHPALRLTAMTAVGAARSQQSGKGDFGLDGGEDFGDGAVAREPGGEAMTAAPELHGNGPDVHVGDRP